MRQTIRRNENENGNSHGMVLIEKGKNEWKNRIVENVLRSGERGKWKWGIIVIYLRIVWTLVS